MIQQHQKSKLLPQTTIVKELPTRAISEQNNESVKVANENQRQLQESIKNRDAASFSERLRIFKNGTK